VFLGVSWSYWTGKVQVTELQALVFVDAKIIGRHDPTLPKNSFVAYFSENTGVHGFSSVEADQTDEAELKAIAFAIKELRGKLQKFAIMSDNESVVSQIKRALVKPSSRPVLLEILAEMKANHDITVEFFGKNPAHSFLNQQIARLQGH